MNNYTICILSDNISNAWQCVERIKESGDDSTIFLGVRTERKEVFESKIQGVYVVPIDYPFSFSWGANKLIRMSASKDVILLNDDALLETPRGFSQLQFHAYHSAEYGILSAAISGVSKKDQKPLPDLDGFTPRQSADACLAFICVYIRREVLERVGLLDERFGPDGYGFEDNDYCHRVERAGWRLGILDACTVLHGLLPSSYRTGPGIDSRLLMNRGVFQSIWGEDLANSHFPLRRPDSEGAETAIPGIVDEKTGGMERRKITL